MYTKTIVSADAALTLAASASPIEQVRAYSSRTFDYSKLTARQIQHDVVGREPQGGDNCQDFLGDCYKIGMKFSNNP